jgi:YggT family protein
VSVLAGISRADVYDYVAALFLVYLVMIFIRVLLSWVPRMPYNPYLRGAVGFVEETVDPYLNVFRSLLRPLGVGGMALDLSPMLAILVLFVVRDVILRAILGQ